MKAVSEIYLDANADAPVLPSAWQAYAEALRDVGSNASARVVYHRSAAVVEDARVRVARSLGAGADEVRFTAGGTQSIAGVLHGLLSRTAHVVSSGLEHPATAANLRQLGVVISCNAVARCGRIDPAAVAAALSPKTELVSLLLASNETGVVQPIAEVAAVCRQRGVLLHVDAVQAVGKIPVDFATLGADFLSLAGHKLGAVGGIGALLVRRGLPREVQSLFPVSDNAPGAASLATALECPRRVVELAELRDELEQRLSEALPGVQVIGRGQPRLPNTSCVRVAGCEGEGIMMALDVAGIAVSTGSACSSGAIEPSPTLLAMGFSAAEAKEAVRFSLTDHTTRKDVQQAAERVIAAARQMLGMG